MIKDQECSRINVEKNGKAKGMAAAFGGVLKESGE